MTPLEWEVACHRDRRWGEAYAVVEREARAHLATLAPGVTISTNQLVERLYPVAGVRGEGQGRQRIYTALKASRKGQPMLLTDCRTKGPLKRIMGGIKARPWVWHRPEVPAPRMICCPNCLTEFPLCS